MEKRLERIENKVDKIADTVADMNATLAAQHATLQEHQRRSAANEKAVEILSSRVEPLQRLYTILRFMGQVVSILAGSGLLVWLIDRMF